jgi:hypothetical protein
MAWKPIREYPTTAPEPEPIVLARDAEKRPMLVLLNKGQFYICPGMPMFYGDNQFGCMIAGGLVDFMEIPE